MKGSILEFNTESRQGVVSGDDGKRYSLDVADWKGSALPNAGKRVDFSVNGEKAEAVYADTKASEVSSKKIAAALFAFFLGAFGAHKFYLGYTKQGVIMLLVFMFGFIPVFLFSFREFQAVNFDAFTTNTWLSVVFVVFGVTVGAYLLNIYALSKVNPSVVVIYIYLQPILSIFFAWLLVNEVNLTLEKGLAGSLIFVGVYLVSFGKRHFEKNSIKLQQ